MIPHPAQRRFRRRANRAVALAAAGLLASSAGAFPGELPGGAAADPDADGVAIDPGPDERVAAGLVVRLGDMRLVPAGFGPGPTAGGILVAVPYRDPESGARGVLFLRPSPADVGELRPGAPFGPMLSPVPCGACATLHGAVELCDAREAGTPGHEYRLRF